MELTIETIRRVESFDADLHNKLKISSIFNYMQDIASYHADELIISRSVLKERKNCDFLKAVRENDSKDIFNCLIEWN